MRKTIHNFLLVCFLLTGCASVPESILEADKRAYSLSINFTEGSEKVLTEVLTAYKRESYAHLDFRGEVALRMGKDKEEVDTWVSDNKKKVDVQLVSALTAFLAIKKDWKKSIILRSEISDFLKNKPKVAAIIKDILEEALTE